VASFHASLLESLLKRKPDVDVVGIVPPADNGGAPVPVYVRPHGTKYADFYASLLQRLRPDVVLMNHVAHAWGATHARTSPAVPALGFVHSWHNITYRSGEESERAFRLTEEALDGIQGLATCSRHCLNEGTALGLRYPGVAEVVHYPLPPPYLGTLDVDSPDRKGITFVGRLMERKNPAVVVEAGGLLQDAHITLVGTGELEPALRKLISERGLERRVKLVGPLAWRHVRELLLRSEVMCLPSSSESFGIVYIEALACGTPVVGFEPSIREIAAAMEMDVGEPLKGEGPGELAEALERVRSRNWPRALLRQRALEVFGLERATTRIMGLLERVARAAA
jgi:glycosyltransferase involved in cell wall biosynthesis